MTNQLVTIKRTSDILSVSKDTIRRLVLRGELRAVRVARRVMIPQSEIDRACTQGVGSRSKRQM